MTQRRQFLVSTAVAVSLARMSSLLATAHSHRGDRTFATPEEARKSPPEELAYVTCVYVGTGVEKADYLATIDLDPASKTYSQVVHRLPMPNIGDELHYPKIAERGSLMLPIDADNKKGGLELNERFLVDFGKEPNGPSRAHEVRFPQGDSTSDIWN